MSGLALVWHLDGRPAVAKDLAPMLAEMARRGPEGEAVALDGSVALGHRHLRTTPEAMVEAMPLLEQASGRILTGDIRLDNRHELLEAFGLHSAGRVIGDGELVLHAYARWAEKCASHLLGDFAFAIWDPRQRRVFAARDQMGMKQLIYAHRQGRVFACATSERAVAMSPGIDARINDLRVAQSLADVPLGLPTLTFFEGIYRLLPGHCLRVDQDNIQITTYWRMRPPEPLRLKSDGDYAEAFRNVLGEAVSARMRCAGTVGATLSGGMDSNSVVAMAARSSRTPIRTYSCIDTAAENCIETQTIQEAIKLENINPCLIDRANLQDWKDDLLASWMELEEPWDHHMTVPRVSYLAAKREGIKVVLDGVGGDIVLGAGSMIARQIGSGRLFGAWREAKGLSDFYGADWSDAMKHYFNAARSAFSSRRVRGIRHAMRGARIDLPDDSAVDLSFAARVNLFEHIRRFKSEFASRPSGLSFAEERIWSWPYSGITGGRETYDRIAAQYGIEARDPYLDLRVVNFLLSLPMEQLQMGGWPKIIQRRAMIGYLPQSVIWRRGKEHPGFAFTQALMDQWPDWSCVISSEQSQLAGRVRPDLLAPENWTRTRGQPLNAALEKVLQAAVFFRHARRLFR